MTRGSCRAFTLLELLVVISIIVMLIAILLPALHAIRLAVRRGENAGQMKTLMDAMATFARGNHDYLPGLDRNGAVIPAGSIPLSASSGAYPEARVALLLSGALVDPKTLTNPIDPDVVPYRPSGAGTFYSTTGMQSGGNAVALKNLSYAMLRLNTPGTPRASAWALGPNPSAPILSDRNTGGNATSQVSSVWNDLGKGLWTGSVGWGDLHVSIEQSHVLNTTYPGGKTIASDNLFYDNDDPTAGPESDAMMVYQDATTGFNQKP